MQIILGTSILVAVRSRQGASFRLLSLIGRTDAFRINLSVPLVPEYAEVLKRAGVAPDLSQDDIDTILDYLCAAGRRHGIHYLWRPVLKNPGYDLLLELAVEAGATRIVTFNRGDVSGCERFGTFPVKPLDFLKEIGAV